MERIKAIISIISIPPISSEKDLTQRSSSIANFQQFFFKYFSKKQIKQFNIISSKCTSVNELFNKEGFVMQFDPNKLKYAIKLINMKIEDKILIHHLALFVLYQYIAFIIQYEQSPSCNSITILFNSLIMFSKIGFQSLIYVAITDVLGLIMNNYSEKLFCEIFDSFSKFLLSHKDVSSSIYSFLPVFLKRLIQENGLTATSFSSKLSTLISLLLSDNPEKFSPNTVNLLFKVIHPFLQTVNEFAIAIMQFLAPLLEIDQINTFFLDIPSIIPQVIESNNEPFIVPPPEIEYETFNPPPSPQCHFGFPEVETFVNGFDASSTPYLPTPSLTGLVSKQFNYLIDLVIKVIGNRCDETVLFLDSFSTLVDVKATSKYRYDYLGLMVFLWVKITDSLPIDQIRAPKCLFEPTLSIFDEKLENSQFFFSMRFYGLSSILKVADPHLDDLLLETVKYPQLFTELVEICNLNLDKISSLLKNKPTMIRTIRLIGLQLQYAEFNGEISVNCIESARLSVFRLIFRIFISTSFVFSFLNDILFMSFFFSLLFEKNIRPFILSQLKVYTTIDLSPAKYELFMNQFCQIIDQACQILPQKAAFLLVSDILSTLKDSKMRPELMLEFCFALQRILQFFDDSEISRFVLLQVINFFTTISKATLKLPLSCITSLEPPLKKFDDLAESDFNALMCLAAADMLTSYKASFLIRNGETLNVMFHVFYTNKNVEVVEFINKLSHANIKNCATLHQSHFDLTLLDFLIENRESDDPNIPRILDVVSTIAGCVSSPAVVQRYISLFIPSENRYLTKTHQYLLKPLLTAFQRALNSPSLVLPLNKRYIIPITVAKTQFEKEGFTFAFWLYYINSEKTSIFSLLNSDGKSFFTLGMKENAITLNGKPKPLTIPNKIWTLVTFLYKNETAIIYLDLEEIWKSTNTHIKFAIGVPAVKIGENENTQVCLGNFGFFDSFEPTIASEIYNLGPRTIRVKTRPVFYYTQENMRTLTGYSSSNENRTFTDILIRFFKVEIFLPLLAQLDLKTKSGEEINFNVHEVISILKAALIVGEMEQRDFLRANGFSIISHLLCSSSAKHVSFNLYKEFFSFHEILILDDLRKELFSQIIMNFELWIVAPSEDHLMIIQHWGKVVFKELKNVFLEILPFAYLLDILRIYYWYEPIEVNKIRCDPKSKRPRCNELNITNCRSKLYNILYDISFIQFRNEDFSALTEHIITLADSQQQLDLLLFMNSLALAPHKPLAKTTFPVPILTRLSYLLQSGNDQIVTAIFNVIYNIHASIVTAPGELTLAQHFDGLMKDIEMRDMTNGLLEDLKRIMVYNTNTLFPLCSYVCYRLESLELFQQTLPSDKFVANPGWALWSVAEAMKLKDNVKRRFIFTFLARCSIRQWQNISDMIEIVAQANGGVVAVDEYRSCLMKVLLTIVLKVDPSLFGHDFLLSLFSMLKLHIFYRKNEQHSSNAALLKMFAESPFNEGSKMKEEKRKVDELRYLYHIDILNLNVNQIDYVFGLRINADGKWLDEKLAQLTLQAMARYKKIIDELDFGFVLAGFLISIKGNEKGASPRPRKTCRSNSASTLNKIINSDDLNSEPTLKEELAPIVSSESIAESSISFNSEIINQEISQINDNQISSETIELNNNQISTENKKSNIEFTIAKTSSNSDQISTTSSTASDHHLKQTLSSDSLRDNTSSSNTDSFTNINAQSRHHLRASLNIKSDDVFSGSQYNIQNNTDFVNLWLSEMQLSKETLELHRTCSQFLTAKAHLYNKVLIIKINNIDSYSGMQQLHETLSNRFFDPSTATSYQSAHRTMKNFSQTAANNMFLAQQQENRNSEFENDINVATEVIQFNDERNSKLWQRLWSNAVSEGSPWDISKITGRRDKPRWRRDNCYCKFFCPFKLKPNHKYTNHYESSIARDAGSQQNYSKTIDEYKQRLLDEYKKNAPPELLEIPPTNITESTVTTVTTATTATTANNNSNNVSGGGGVVKKKKNKMEYKCELIKLVGVFEGVFAVFDRAIHIDIEKNKKTYILPMVLIKRILLRRRFHHKTAIEIFMETGDTYFVNFPQYRSSDILQRMILPESVLVQKDEPSVFFAQTGFTERWRRGEISNFEYLMLLNIISGRSFNDSSQYPFLPWVLSDYTREKLDLTDPTMFRDLSKPIGAIGAARFQQLQKRMKDMEQFQGVSYLYSSFAICPLSLYLWLFRMEPFTSLHIEMQSGKFDHPSRLFSSIPDTFSIVTKNMNDYRELAPEFYFQPDFLRNDNELDLGKAKGAAVGDVVLPAWARSSEECVYLFRKALESEIASSTINKWIDLVWGYKQRGEKALESDNVYKQEMYETAWTPAVLKDAGRRAEIEASMCHVGQFPPQLFTSPHPEKLPQRPRPNSHARVVKLPYASIRAACISRSDNLDIAIYTTSNEIAIITLTSQPQPSQSQPNSMSSNDELAPEDSGADDSLPADGASAGNIRVTSDIKLPKSWSVVSIHCIPKEHGSFMCLLGSGRIVRIAGSELRVFHQELTRVSAVSCSDGFIGVVSDDTTLNLFGRFLPSSSIPFYGNSVLCSALSTGFRIAVCGTVSGDLVVSSLYEGKKVNVIKLGKEYRPTKLLVTKSWGFIVTYATSDSSCGGCNGCGSCCDCEKMKHFLFLHNVNGTFIRSRQLSGPIVAWCTFSSDSDFDFIAMSFDQGKMHAFEAFYLDVGEPFYRCYKQVVDMVYVRESRMIAAVKEDGNVIFHPISFD